MHHELVQLGSIIKKRREERGVSLKEAENATSIRLAYLQAIEDGHFGKLISPVYAQGFLKKYSQFLELDSDELLRQYPYAMKILREKGAAQADDMFGFGSLEVRGSPGTEVKWLPNVAWLVISIGAVLVGWLVGRYFGLF